MVEVTPSRRLTLLLDASPLKPIHRWLWVLSTGGTLLDGFIIFILGVAMPLITASGVAAGVAKIGATLGVFVLPILKDKFRVPAVLGMMAAVSVLGLLVTLVFGHEDAED